MCCKIKDAESETSCTFVEQNVRKITFAGNVINNTTIKRSPINLFKFEAYFDINIEGIS